ncbi:HAD-IA family hydrolase [Candidatus Cloacimonadota bacterium]
MIKCLVFDLSEVLIGGIVGFENSLSEKLKISRQQILQSMGGELLEELCRGQRTEDSFIEEIITKEKWDVSLEEIKSRLRDNFLITIDGMPETLQQLKQNYILILLSDHCREWIHFIEKKHEFLKLFNKTYYSYETGFIKTEPAAFLSLLKENDLNPEEIIFIDDNPKNIKTAESLGISGILFENPAQLGELLHYQN